MCRPRKLQPSAISGSAEVLVGRQLDAGGIAPSIRGPRCRRTPPHTTHHQDFPERVTITRPHHPFERLSLEVLRQVRMPAGSQFVLILPNGSKSLIPVEWTDFNAVTGPPQDLQLAASPEEQPAMLPSSSEIEFSAPVRLFRSSIARRTDTPIYASTSTSRCPLQDSGPRWIRSLLSCRTLSFPTTCRFNPAHSR